MFNCVYCEFESEQRIPLYHMCCEANMIHRCVELTNHPYAMENLADNSWMCLSEVDRAHMTVHPPLAKKAYQCYHDMNALLDSSRDQYHMYKVDNRRFNDSDSPENTIYIDIQVLNGIDTILHIYRITDEIAGEECYLKFLENCRIARLREERLRQERIQVVALQDAINRGHVDVSRNTLGITLFNSSNNVEADESETEYVFDSETEYSDSEYESDDEDAIVKKEDLVTKSDAVETSDCYICFETLGNTNKMILRCGHQFCGDCIFTHYDKQGINCPVCRAQYVVCS